MRESTAASVMRSGSPWARRVRRTRSATISVYGDGEVVTAARFGGLHTGVYRLEQVIEGPAQVVHQSTSRSGPGASMAADKL